MCIMIADGKNKFSHSSSTYEKDFGTDCGWCFLLLLLLVVNGKQQTICVMFVRA